ncbi:MAG: GAF domain-containing protein [Chloroflexi bacterium]|nr:GAF domain-containing protein [Chloroflexota bacterium]
MAETNKLILLIAKDDWLIETIDSVLRGPSLFQGAPSEGVLRQTPTADEALRKFSDTEFLLILLEYQLLETAAIEQLQAGFARTPIILLVTLEQEAEATAIIQAGKVQDYLLAEELTENIMRRLLRPAHLYTETRRRLREMQVLNSVADVASRATNVTDLLTDVTHIITNNLYPYHFGFVMRQENGRWQPHPAYHSLHPLQLPITVDETKSAIGWVARHGLARRIADAPNEPDCQPLDPRTAAELCAPLIIQGQTIGVMNVESAKAYSFTEADEQMLLTLGRQLATAIEKINLFEAERQQRQEAETLRDIMATLASTLDHNQVLDEILAYLDKVVKHDTACLFLLDGDYLRLQAAHGFDDPDALLGTYYPATDPFFCEMQRTRQPIYVPDVRQHADFRCWGDAAHVRGWICAPLVVHDQVVGVLTVDNRKAEAYTSRDVALAQAFANQAAVAIENARLYKSAQMAHHTAEIFRAANEALTQTLDTNQVMETLLDFLVKLVPVDSASILLLDEDGDYARLHAARGFENWTDVTAVTQIRINIHTNRTLSPIFQQKRSVLIADTLTHPDWEQFPATNYLRSWLGVPISAGNKVIGAFSLDKVTPRFFTSEHRHLVESLTAQANVALQNAQYFAQMERRAAELATITRISAALRLAQSVDEMLAIVLQQATAVVGAVFGSIYLVDADSGDLVLQACLPPDLVALGHRHTPGEGITGHVAASGQPYVSPNIWQDPLFVPFPVNETFFQSLCAAVSLPLQTQTQVIGVLHISLDRPHEFFRGEMNLLLAVAEIAASALSRALVLATLEQRVDRRTRELAEANERLQELDRLKTKFVSDVSHELRTPITNLTLYLDLLERGQAERREQYQAILRKQVDRLNSLIEDTLQLSRLDMGKTEMQFAAEDVNEIVAECVAEVQPLAEKADGLLVTAVLQPNLPPILADRGQLVVVLQNLLQNAITYTPQGAVCVRTTAVADGPVCLSISDTGTGITDEDLPHIFERFYRGTAVSQSTLPGTGLGLSIAHEIIERHQGTIQVESHTGAGTTFTVCLPQANEGRGTGNAESTDQPIKKFNFFGEVELLDR